MGEVVSSNPSYVCDYQNHLDSILNFPAYDPIVPFLSNSAGTDGLISVINDMKSACKDVSVLGIFTESHDVPRIASWTADINLAKNALVYTFMWDGIPIVYAGQEQHFSGYADPANREATWLSGYDQSSELYITTTAINAIRNHVISIDPGYTTYGIKAIYNDAHTAAFRKGTDGKQIVSVITNGGENSGTSTLKLAGTGWRAGTEVVEILTCRRSTVAQDGSLEVAMDSGLPRVYVAGGVTDLSMICQDSLIATMGGGTMKGEAVGRWEAGMRGWGLAVVVLGSLVVGMGV